VERTVVTTVVRHVEDADLTVQADIPADWSELTADGYVLVAGGRMDGETETMAPVLQVTLRRAADADAVWQTVRSAAAELPEGEVAFEARRPTDGGEEAVLEVVHLSAVTGGTQVSILRTVFLADRSLTLSVVGTCGGGASPETRDALRRIIASVQVQP